jgi:hypothetical protein
MPKWSQSTLHAAGVLAGNPLDSRRTQSQHVKPSHVLSPSKPAMPMHFYMVQSSNPHTYNEVVGKPLWEVAIQEEYD